MAKFELDVNEFHNQFCIQGECSQSVACIVKSVVMCQWVSEKAYKVSRESGAFLQSYNEGSPYNLIWEDLAYILVEFWSDDHDAIMSFIDYVNEMISKIQ